MPHAPQALMANGAPAARAYGAPNGVLSTLVLHFNHIGDAGAEAVAEALKVRA